MLQREMIALSDGSESKTLHQQLYSRLRQAVETGEYKMDQMIPSEYALCGMFGVSRTTVRNVLAQLVAERVLYRVPGKGTFVARPQITTTSLARKGIREQLEEMSYETDTALLSKGVLSADGEIARQLQVPQGSQIFQIRRLRSVNQSPLSLHTSYIPSDVCPELLSDDLEKRALCDILEGRYRIFPLRGEESLESVTAAAAEAKLLGIQPGAGLLYLECTMFSTQNIPYLLDQVLFRGDSIKLRFSYSRQRD